MGHLWASVGAQRDSFVQREIPGLGRVQECQGGAAGGGSEGRERGIGTAQEMQFGYLSWLACNTFLLQLSLNLLLSICCIASSRVWIKCL